jgi:hypothetical protein
MASRAGNGSDRPQPWARPFVTLLLAALLICGIFGIEAWPLSGFRLFSAPRGSVMTTWRLVGIHEDGAVVPVNISRLGAGYRGFGASARAFRELSFGNRSELCGVWAEAAARIGIHAVGFMVVRIDQSLTPRDGDGPREGPRRRVTGTCPVTPA